MVAAVAATPTGKSRSLDIFLLSRHMLAGLSVSMSASFPPTFRQLESIWRFSDSMANMMGFSHSKYSGSNGYSNGGYGGYGSSYGSGGGYGGGGYGGGDKMSNLGANLQKQNWGKRFVHRREIHG